MEEKKNWFEEFREFIGLVTKEWAFVLFLILDVIGLLIFIWPNVNIKFNPWFVVLVLGIGITAGNFNVFRKQLKKISSLNHEKPLTADNTISELEKVYELPLLVNEQQHNVYWKDLFFYLGSKLFETSHTSYGICDLLVDYFKEIYQIDAIRDETIQEVFIKTKIQFRILNLIETRRTQGPTHTFPDMFGNPVTTTDEIELWELTEKGERIILNFHKKRGDKSL